MDWSCWDCAAAWVTKSKDLIGYPLAAIGAFVAYRRWSLDESRKSEALAFENVDAIFDDPACQLALNMIDWYVNDAPVPASLGGSPGQRIKWTPEIVVAALRINSLRFNTDEVVIRNAFDALLNRLSRLGYHVRRRTVSPREIPATIVYYFRRLDERQEDLADGFRQAFYAYVAHYAFTDVDQLTP